MTKPEHGYFDKAFEAYLVPQLNGGTSMVDTMPIPAADRFGIAAAELTGGFSYLFWDSEVRHNTVSGNIQLPLSVERPFVSDVETAVAMPLHAPVAQRIIKIKASRNGSWPKIPTPINARTDANGCKERLLSARQVADTPKLDSDNANMIYSIHAEWIYAVSRPTGHKIMNAQSDLDKFPSISSPLDRTTPDDNSANVTAYFDTSGSIY